MARWPGAEPIYEVADTFRSRCLIEQRSLLWPERQVWTRSNLDALWHAFVDNPDPGKQSFMQKWKGQLQDQTDDVHRMAADVTALYYLFPANIGSDAKKAGVQEVLSWRLQDEGEPPELPALNVAFDRFVGHSGIFYLTGRPWQVAYYLKFARSVLVGDGDPTDLESSRHLADLVRAEVTGSTSSRHILLHLLFPDAFERIASEDIKQKIAKTYAALAGDASDVDVRLLNIRRSLTQQSGQSSFDFYDPQIKSIWEPIATTTTLPPLPPGVGALDDLAALTHHELTDLNEIESLLLDKKQIIFEGPPGSGKTYMADLFARYFTENPLEGEHDERIEVVQFHQSYGYEDFVQGIRPVTDGEGRLQYRVMPGIFLQHCERARANPDKRFFLIIDEINRGNLSRIFGELLMLLEYRDKRVRLPYAAGDGVAEQSHLQIPPNLYLIGTMNSTDRSLAMIDYALRRRFFFYRLLPVVDGRATVLERWLASQDFTASQRAHVLAYFVRINQEIGTHLSADFQIGHSYFMVDRIAEPDVLGRVWRRALRPLLEEYFHTARGSDEIIAALAPSFAPPAAPVLGATDGSGLDDDTDA